MQINIVLHNIYNTTAYEDDFGYDIKGLLDIINFLEDVKRDYEKVDNYFIYFDDGYKSLLDLVIPSIPKHIYTNIIAAITTQLIETDGYLSKEDILYLKSIGVEFASHGVSHAALAIYDKETNSYLLDTPKDGEYINADWGKAKPLSRKEVKYQLLESKRYLENLLGEVIQEFVFPFGLYNKDTLRINKSLDAYKFLTTCDFDIDNGIQSLRPRYLVYGGTSTEKIKTDILQILK